jgi:indole-3-glycerol phosphate synthase
MESDFLARMARASHARVERARRVEPESVLKRRAADAPPPASISLSEGGFDLIAEVKFQSPSAGLLISDGRDRDAAARALVYERAGAAVASVLTEPARFGGDLRHLAEVAGATRIPVMRKDFLVDPYQVWEARACGASGVLVILRMLEDERVDEMIRAAGEAGMFVLLEVFDEDDLERAIGRSIPGIPTRDVWIGVNTRDLTTLTIVPERLERLAGRIPLGRIAVAESGIQTAEDAACAARLGYSLALVGTALMRASDPGPLLESLLDAGRGAKREGGRDPLAGQIRRSGRLAHHETPPQSGGACAPA